MCKFVLHALYFSAAFGLLAPPLHSADRPVLRILNWSEYIDVDPDSDPSLPIAQRSQTLKKFAEQFNCDINYYEFETSEEAMRALAQSPGYHDIVIIDDFAASQLLNAGIAENPDPDKIPNLEHLDHAMLKAFDLGEGLVGVPYLYGTTGLLYRKDFFPEGVRSWKAFFDLENEYPVSVFADHKSTFTQALLALDLSPVKPSEADLRTAAKFLEKVVKAERIAAHTSDIDYIQQAVSSGKVGAAVIYSGDALTAMEADPNLGFTLPEEGFELYLDRMLVLKTTEKRRLAHAFINFILEPEVHAHLAAEMFFATPSISARKILEQTAPEQLENPAIYPRAYQMDKGYPVVLSSPLIPRFAKHLFGD